MSLQTPLPKRRDAQRLRADAHDGPTQHAGKEGDTKRWAARPGWARAIRWGILLLPSILSFFVTFAFARRYPPHEFMGGMPTPLWWISLFSVGLIVLLSTERLARRMLPLAALFKMSLVFPDAAPSRFSLAMKTNSTRKLERRLEEVREKGLPDDRAEHAELMLELVAALSVHDRLTRGHCERVRAYTDMIAEEMKIPEEDAAKLRWAALLHDVGKIYVPAGILNKSGRPTEDEWESLKSHTWKGHELIGPLEDFLGVWGLAVRNHHERWDGNGYPDRLAGTEIPLGGRIVAVADAFDVMTSARSYKEPRPASEAREEIARCAGGQFDPDVARAFLNIGLGRLRFAVGPLSWLANFSAVANVPAAVSAAAPAMFASAAAVVGVTVGSVARPDVVAFEAPSTTTVPAESTEVPTTQPALTVTAATPIAQAGVLTIVEDNPSPVILAAQRNGTDVIFILIKGPRGGTLTLPNDGSGFNFLTTGGAGVEQRQPISLNLAMAAQIAPAGMNVSLTGVYTPHENFFGTDDFKFRVCNSAARSHCSDATITVQVSPANDAPAVSDESISISEDALLTVTQDFVLANDADVDGDSLRAIWTRPDDGVTNIADGVLSYQMPLNTDSDFSVDYRVCDASVCVPAALEVQVNPLDDRPVANDDAILAVEDVPFIVDALTVKTNDQEFDGDATVVTFDSHPNYDPAAATFSPPLNSNETINWGYTLCDASGPLCDRANITIMLTPIADAPDALGEWLPATDEDTSIEAKVADVLANDVDPDNDPTEPMTITWGTPSVAGGSFTTDLEDFTYVPPKDFNGEVTIPYTVCDASLCSDEVLLTLKFAAVNDAPIVPVSTTVTGTENLPTSVTFAKLLADALDPDSTDLRVEFPDPLPAGFGFLPDATTPTGFTYTPVPESSTDVVVRYEICDDSGDCGAGEMVLEFEAVDDPPVPGSLAGSTDEDTDYVLSGPAFETLINDIDTGFADLTISLASTNPTLGTPSIDPGTGEFTFTPTPNKSGVNVITYTACDLTTTTGCPTGDITITVKPVNDAPTIDVPVHLIAGTEDIPAVINPGDLDALVSDIDNADAELQFTFTTSGAGTLTPDPTSRGFTYIPVADSSADVAITYTLCDTGTPTECDPATGTINLTFAAVDDAPDPNAFAVPAELEDTPITITRADLEAGANDIDTAGADLTFNVGPPPATDAALGAPVELTPGGDWVLNPIPYANGTATYPFTVCDLNAVPGPNCEILEVKLTLTSVNNKPVIDTTIPITFAGTEDALLAVRSSDLRALGFVSDPDDQYRDLEFVYSEPTVDAGIDPPGDIFERRENNRSFKYTPSPNSVKDVTITFVACDDEGLCSDQTGTIILTFGPQDDPPSPSDLNLPAVDEDSTATIVVTRAQLVTQSNDPDTADADLLITIEKLGGEDLGPFDDSTGDFTLSLTPDANGVADYAVTVCDQKPNCENFNLKVTVNPQPDAPILISGPSGASTLFTPPTPVVLPTDWTVVEVDGESVTANPDPINPSIGSVALVGPEWVFTPNDPIPVGTSIDLGFSLCDPTTPTPMCPTATWTVTAAANQPPQFDAPFTVPTQHVNVPMIPVTFGASDAEGDPISVSKSLPLGLVVTDNGDGTYTISGTPTQHALLGTNRSYHVELSDGFATTKYTFRIRFSDQGLSPHRGEVLITEIANQHVVACEWIDFGWGPIQFCAEVEAVELHNPASGGTVSMAGWTIQDFAPGSDRDEFGSVVLGVNREIGSLNGGEYNIVTTLFEGTPFNYNGDDVWLLDTQGLIVDYAGWQHTNWATTWGLTPIPIPDAELGIWDTDRAAMAEIGYRPAGPAWTLSLATRTAAGTAACWELTSTGDALTGTHVCGAPDATATIDHPDAQGLYDTDPSYTHSLLYPNFF